jgi:hypothetical protein
VELYLHSPIRLHGVVICLAQGQLALETASCHHMFSRHVSGCVREFESVQRDFHIDLSNKMLHFHSVSRSVWPLLVTYPRTVVIYIHVFVIAVTFVITPRAGRLWSVRANHRPTTALPEIKIRKSPIRSELLFPVYRTMKLSWDFII